MQKPQMQANTANHIMLAVVCVLVLGWFQQAETRAANYPYVPLITKISPFPKSGQPAWIEFHNPLTKPVKASTLMIVINDEYKYAFPKQLPPVPPRGYVLLKLDGKGAPEVFSYRGGLAELHTPWDLTGVMKGKPGQIAVYWKIGTATPKYHLAGFVSWGAPGSRKSQTPERDRLWKPEWFVEMGQGTGEYNPEALKKADYVIGLYPGSKTAGLMDWVIYARDEARPGKPNAVPRPVLFIPHDGAVVRSKDITIRWLAGKRARAYRFQMAKDPDFGSIIEDTTLKFPAFRPPRPLEEGAYYYRVKVIDFEGRESAYSTLRMLIAKWMDLIRPLQWEKTLNADHVPQIKDSHLLCLDECPSDLNSTATMHWDKPHPPVNIFSILFGDPDHGLGNCVRASIAMMVSVYGKTLSQDRIAYYTEEKSPAAGDGRPEGDLAHFVGMTYVAADGGENTAALDWALGASSHYTQSNPTFSQVKSWLYVNRPIMTRTPMIPQLGVGHMRVLDGYRIDNSAVEWVRILDPLDPNPRWETFSSWDSSAAGTWVGPASAPGAREDEADIGADSDGDGIMDFDEKNRFGTDPQKKDTDGDGKEDKDEIRGYLFDAANNYLYGNPDENNNGVRKELDPNE